MFCHTETPKLDLSKNSRLTIQSFSVLYDCILYVGMNCMDVFHSEKKMDARIQMMWWQWQQTFQCQSRIKKCHVKWYFYEAVVLKPTRLRDLQPARWPDSFTNIGWSYEGLHGSATEFFCCQGCHASFTHPRETATFENCPREIGLLCTALLKMVFLTFSPLENWFSRGPLEMGWF